MNESHSLLRYRDEDRALLPIAELSVRARVSQGFIRHCISLGCPAPEGCLSQEMLLNWLIENYAAVRAWAGMADLPPVEGVHGQALARLKLANAIATLLEHSESRSSDVNEKKLIREMRQLVEETLERR